MSGNRILLDTNAAIALINKDPNVVSLVNQAKFIAISIITAIEFLSFVGLSQRDKILFEDFCTEVAVIDISFDNSLLIKEITAIRQNTKMKLPDAIIAASAITNRCSLITRDSGFKRIINLSTLSF